MLLQVDRIKLWKLQMHSGLLYVLLLGESHFLEPLPIVVSVVHCKGRRPSVRILQIGFQLTVAAYKSHRYYFILLTPATHDTIF